MGSSPSALGLAAADVRSQPGPFDLSGYGRELRPKAGVLFCATPSGGTALDIQADRFLSLGPLSASIWSSLSAGVRPEAIANALAETAAITPHDAVDVLSKQLRLWTDCGLLSPATPDTPLPVPKPTAGGPSASYVDTTHPGRRRSPLTLLSLYLLERSYSKSFRTQGLAITLVRLQEEQSTRAVPADALHRIVDAYRLLRRGFRQGHTATDCLARSAALTAALRRAGVAADLCIGIRDLPFAAHAWVEADGLVLNETRGNVDRYTPIGRF